MPYLDEDISRIRERLRQQLLQATGANGQPLFPDQDLPGTPEYTIREVMSRVLRRNAQQINQMVEGFSPRTARGAELDRWAEYLGMPRTQTTRSTGSVLIKSEVTGETLERLSGSRRIFQGTRLESGSTVLVTTEDAVIAPAEKSVEVGVESTRQRTGTIAQAGTLFAVQNRDLLEAEVIQAVTGGQNAETDEQLRYRLSLAMRAPSTFEGLEATLLSNPDVDEVQITEAAYGPGTAEVYVSPAVAYPTEELRLELEAQASQGPGQVYVVFQ